MLRTVLTVIGVLLAWKVVRFGASCFAMLWIVIGMVLQEAYRKNDEEK